MAQKKPRPKGLGRKAGKLWDEITGTYDLRPDETQILEEACREVDLVTRLEEALADAPLIVSGSMGQQVSSPLVSELRQHRAVVKSLLGALRLPDEPGEAKGASRSAQAREAAKARWAKTG